MNIAIIGAGMIGQERIKALAELGEDIVVVDPIFADAITLTQALDLNPDWCFVCTPHHETPEIVANILQRNINVLVEKPLGRTLREFEKIMTWHKDSKINVGLNYRFYRGISQLIDDVRNDLFGDLVSVNMTLGLGDPPGSEKTWRLDPNKSGQGALLDPGIHLIDLAMLISDGTLELLHHKFWRGFWDTGINEESHVLASDLFGTIYNIQSSTVRWRNTLRIEVNGTKGYGVVEGRNRHYGNQTYRIGTRWGWQSGKSQKDSEELVVDYDGEDSFLEETKAVLYGYKGSRPATWEDNLRCLKFIG